MILMKNSLKNLLGHVHVTQNEALDSTEQKARLCIICIITAHCVYTVQVHVHNVHMHVLIHPCIYTCMWMCLHQSCGFKSYPRLLWNLFCVALVVIHC